MCRKKPCRYCMPTLLNTQTAKRLLSLKIKIAGIDTFDLCHYGWNLWNHFRVAQQPETAAWLVNVFEHLDGSNPNTLYKKFTHNERYTYKIERADDIK